MNEEEQALDRIERWLLEAAEGNASPDETARINARLAADPTLRAALVRRLLEESWAGEELQALEAESVSGLVSILPKLRDDRRPAPPPPETADEPDRPRPRAARFPRLAALAATAGLIAAGLLFALFLPWNAPVGGGLDEGDLESPRPEVVEVDGFAILTRAVGVEWAPGGPAFRVDDRIAARRLKILSGLLQLEFFGGATVVLEGPADFEIESAMRCRCRGGKLRADVPPQSVGFTIAGGDVDVVDLGTEFAMRVDEKGAGEVHVIQGEVSVRRPLAEEAKRLKHGEAVRFSGKGELADLAADGDSFVDVKGLRMLEDSGRAERYKEWLAHRGKWASDPALLLYYDFERGPGSDRRLASAIAGAPKSADGAIVGCRWTEGRFVGKGALEFKRTSDRVRVDLPGEFASLTLTAWLRVEGFEQWYSSLLLADGYEFGEVHWQLAPNGKLKLSVSGGGDPNRHRVFYSDWTLKPQDLGRWMHFATVYDHEARRVRHYVDGKLDCERKIRVDAKLRFGPAEIGNWVPVREGREAVRSLNGLLDEMAVFRRALSAEEVAAAYRAGSPYP